MVNKAVAYQRCIRPACAAAFDLAETLSRCPRCNDLLDVVYDWDRAAPPKKMRDFSRTPLPPGGVGRISGVWRFSALLPFAPAGQRVSIGEGHTQLRPAPKVARYVGLDPRSLYLQYEGLNPSGSFKDNGMAAAFTHARMVGAKVAACASTGNTSASLAAFSAATGLMKAVIFVGSGKIAYGKLSQALEFGAKTLQVEGDFDDAMARVQEVCRARGIYLVNSLNPFRLEGQKTVMYRVLEGLDWEAPEWIVVPGGNLGNASAFGKAFLELKELGLISRMPRLAVINAEGAPTLNNLVNCRGLAWNGGDVDEGIPERYYAELADGGEKAHTLASAIEINRPVNLKKCLRALAAMSGVVRTVSDQEILDAKAQVGTEGIGCEPASAASVAGLRRLVEEGVVDRDARVACVLTGHPLKDPHATVGYHAFSHDELLGKYGSYGVESTRFRNAPVPVENDLEKILRAIDGV
ncbi:MAG: threonine synthase [Planctomycetota bacterium]